MRVTPSILLAWVVVMRLRACLEWDWRREFKRVSTREVASLKRGCKGRKNKDLDGDFVNHFWIILAVGMVRIHVQ